MRVTDDTHPRLRDLLSGYAPDYEFTDLDPDCPAEAEVSNWPDSGRDELLDDVDDALASMRTMSDDEAGGLLAMQVSLPAGPTWGAWLQYIAQHVAEFYPHRNPQTLVDDGAALPRSARFADTATANTVSTQVLTAHESRLRRWAQTHDGTTRLHLYAELGRPVGHWLDGDEVRRYVAAGKDPLLEPTRHPATAAVVVMRRQHETGRPYIATTYPERSFPTQAREQFPDLALLFGGYLGQDCSGFDGTRWAAERNLNLSTAPEVRERIADQLVRLLQQPDDDALRADVESLGSYVLPVAVRRWVTGLHRRMTRLYL